MQTEKITLLLALVVLFSCFSVVGAVDSGCKEGYVSDFTAAQLVHEYDEIGTSSDVDFTSFRGKWDTDYVYNYQDYRVVDCQVVKHAAVDYDDIPGTVSDPAIIKYQTTEVGTANIYVFKKFDKGGHDVRADLYVQLNINYTWMKAQPAATTRTLTFDCDWTIIGSYYDKFSIVDDQGLMDAQINGDGFGIAFGYVAGTTLVASDTGCRVVYAADFKNQYDITPTADRLDVNITRLFSGSCNYDVVSALRYYTGDLELSFQSANSDSNESFEFVNDPCVIAIYYSGSGRDYVIWDSVGLGENSRVYGYVFDAKDVFVIGDATVELGTRDTASDSGGYYNFGDVMNSLYTLDASKMGYQDLNNGSGVVLNITSSARYDISLIKNETVNSGTCTVAGVVLDSTSKTPIESALVVIENSSYDSYVYTNEMGYYVFYDLSNTTYALTGSKEGYYNMQLDISLADLDTAYYYQFDMVSEDAAAPAPTPTPTPGGDATVEGWKSIFNMMGLGAYMGYIMAFLCMAGMGYVGGKATNGNTMGVMMGFFFGYIVGVAIGWLPMWTVAVAICVTIYFVVKGVGR